ncbi:MAG: MarR family winged helix-turn-helix transcriptional regulator [Acidobacteriota bacterium]|nr:MarR family winged helix-turn-helix transcriptional regulator [Acidobacteriota bacterium]
MKTPTRPRTAPEAGRLLADRFVLTDVVSHLLRRAHFRAENLFDAELGRWGLTPRQKALLVMAHQHPGETQNQLAERVALDRASFAEMLRRMTARGLLKRVAARRDRRAYAIFITPKGTALLRNIMPLDRVVEARIIEPVPLEYRPIFLKCLKLMIGLEAPQSPAPQTRR